MDTTNTIRKIAYQKYQLYWMMSHCHPIAELIEYLENYKKDCEGDISLNSILNNWENEVGFNGSIWACYDEFLNNEYLDKDLMMILLDTFEYSMYLDDINNKND